MSEDAKLSAFRAFDFDSHASWRAYRQNLEIPPGKEALEVKFRAKWYKREIDPDFDVALVTVTPAPQPATAGQATAGGESRSRSAPAVAQAATGTTRAAAGSSGGSGSGGSVGARMAGRTGEMVLLSAHVVMLLSALVTLQPLNRYLSWQAYFMFCRTALVAGGYKIYLRFGLPTLRPFPAAAAPWLQQVAQSTEFFHFMVTTLMLQVPQMWMGVLPLAAAALRPTLAALGSRWPNHPLWARYGRTAQAAVEQGQPAIQGFATNIEIALGFQAILGIMATGLRGAMLAYVYWNSLRMRYWAPESRPYHMQAWAAMHARVQPLLLRAPALQRYLDFPIRWFQQLGAHRQ